MGKFGNALELESGEIFEFKHEDWIDEQITEILQKRGVKLPVDSYAFQKLRELIRKAKADIYKGYLKIISGESRSIGEDSFTVSMPIRHCLNA